MDAVHVPDAARGPVHVDRSLLEAAEIDGARYWRIFFKIVLPAIWPVMAIAILIRGLDLFRIFDVDLGVDRGRPGHHDRDHLASIPTSRDFSSSRSSYTAAIAFLIIALMSLVVTLAIRRMGIAR